MDRGMRSAVLAAALGMAARAAGAQAVGEGAGEVDALVRHGVELRQRGDDAGALAELQRAHARSEEPRVLAQLALAEQAMGRWLDADRHLRAALRSGADPWIVRNRAALHQAEEQLGAHLGRLRVTGAVEGAEVYANDERVATLPMAEPARVVAGTNVIEVRATGYVTMSRRVQVEPGQESRETFAFVREAPSVTPSSSLWIAPATPSAEPEVARGGGAQRAFAWASLATGAAGVGLGVFALMRRDGLVSQYDQRRDPVCPGTSSATQPTVCASNLDDIAAMQALAIGGFVGGGALALASVVLFATLPSSGESPRGLASVRCGGGPGQVGVSCGGVF
jgi:hypothetical protein